MQYTKLFIKPEIKYVFLRITYKYNLQFIYVYTYTINVYISQCIQYICNVDNIYISYI